MKRHTILLSIFIAALTWSGSIASAQPRFILKRTKAVTAPIFVQLLAGYNGVSNPAEILQDHIRPIDGNTYGGLMVGLQGAIELDTLIGQPAWGGVEFYYHRYVNRRLQAEPDVHYIDDPERKTPVENNEQLHAVGFQLLLAYNIVHVFQIQVAGGVQYLYPIEEVSTEVKGLFSAHFIPTASVGGRFIMLEYAHGSIDANVRIMKGFGDYGSIEVQSMLGFTFRF